jgi:hypothetical protein
MAKIYLYKLTADTGGAPCIKRGLLSLAICKPMIRMKAKVGDLIFGFAANQLKPANNRLIYAARVTEKLSGGNYYKAKRYAPRGDCIYKFTAGRFKWKEGSLHHGPTHVHHDLGNYRKYPRANVLLSDDFRYFGEASSDKYKAKFPKVRRAIARLARGHRVHHNNALRAELLKMQRWVWQTRKKVSGRPTSAPSSRICYRGGSCTPV